MCVLVYSFREHLLCICYVRGTAYDVGGVLREKWKEDPDFELIWE